MSDPFRTEENLLPEPADEFRGIANKDGIGKRAFAAIAKLWQPRGTTAEPAAATVSRYSMRLIDRETRKAYSADTLVNAKLAEDPAGAREAMEAQSSAESFADRFDDSTRYSNGSAITHLVTTPKVGPAWRLHVGGGQIAPQVTIPPASASSFQGEADDDTLTIAAGHTFQTKDPVRVSGAGLPSPLVADTTYYVIRVSGTVIKLATSTANAIAGTAINLTTDGSSAQSVFMFGAARGLTPSDGAGLYYLGSAVNTANGKFVLAFEFTPVATDQTAGALDAGLNISFSNAEMITAGGGIVPEDTIHINIAPNGIQSAVIYKQLGSISLTCTSTEYNAANSVYPWNSRVTAWQTGRKQVILISVDGDYVRVIVPGHGAIEFYHPDVSTRVAATTNFWWEPSGADGPGGQKFRRKLVLHRVSDSLEQVQLEQWGLEEPSGFSGLQSEIETRARFLGNPAVAWTSGNAPTSSDDYHVATPRKMRADRGFWSRPWSGYLDYPVPITNNLVTAELSSGAGASNTNLLTLSDLPLANTGDWNEFEITGTFGANGNTKGVQIWIATAGVALVDTGAITPNGGTFRAFCKRVRHSGRSHDFYGEIIVTSGGVTTRYTGVAEYNNGTLAFSLQTRVTGTAAGDVKIRQGVYRAEVRA